MNATELIELFHLEPLAGEGGFFRQTYKSTDILPSGVVPSMAGGPRHLGTAIYYLLTPETFSCLHRLPGDEIYHFYLGDPVTLLLLFPNQTATVITLGQDVWNGQQLQALVPKGTWQGSLLNQGGRFALMGTTMAPGFDDEDYEPGNRDRLTASYPEHAELIHRLTG